MDKHYHTTLSTLSSHNQSNSPETTGLHYWTWFWKMLKQGSKSQMNCSISGLAKHICERISSLLGVQNSESVFRGDPMVPHPQNYTTTRVRAPGNGSRSAEEGVPDDTIAQFGV
uniref:Uncharacterized protein n=1 Tax=Fusarium oxysporum (strain Fo5176) TaxID=660025 RepID=A0A0D2XWI4_FUSOF